ncbi:hypothetical protein HDU97_007994 [Phlyctochytrium planicorne]|nr:hypothetical protein HDU97_007994 [Phlyctochytrium planicorne]
MYEEDGYKAVIMICGGVRTSNRMAHNQCWSLEADNATAVWKREADMPRGRLMPDSSILPDGSILYMNGARYGVAGGNAGQAQYAAGPIFETDLFDTVTGTWVVPDADKNYVGKMVVPRLYHSGAILLDDATVASVGSEMQNYVDVWGPEEGNVVMPLEPLHPECWPSEYENGTKGKPCTNPYETRVEIFTPAYLLTDLPRPRILSSPPKLVYNLTYIIQIDGAVPIRNLSLIRYSTSTHSTNTDQRFLGPKILFNNGTHVAFRTPPHGGVAPPGNYHIFVVTAQGIPSMSVMTLIGEGSLEDALADEVPAIPSATSGVSNGQASSNSGIRRSDIGEAGSWVFSVLTLFVSFCFSLL